MLRCPVCKETLTISHSIATCCNGHSFDQAKQGYFHLYLSNKKRTGDNLEMSKARRDFLSAGHYYFLGNELLQILKNYQPKTLVDLGCGEGYYTKIMKEVVDQVIGIDLSKESLKLASRDDKESLYLVASIAELPLNDQSVDFVTKLFAPTYLTEIQRILKPGGIFLCVDVGVNHLVELKELLYDEIHLNEIKTHDEFNLINEYEITSKKVLSSKDLHNLYTMTPYRYRTRYEDYLKLESVCSLEVTFSFHLHAYRMSV